jgi:glycerate kinase
MKKAILVHYPDAEVVSLPIADGGEGSVEAFVSALNGNYVNCQVNDPHGKEITASYGLLPDETAIIEVAAAVGLPLVDENHDVGAANTFGVGQLIKDAVAKGCKKIILGLGGSSTNDGGTGAAAACGVQFLDKQGNPFIPVGRTLDQIAHIDTSKIMPEIKACEFIAMCDVDNPLYGKNGAAYIYGPQKGADQEMITLLDNGLHHLSEVVMTDLGIDVQNIPGAGAAGGMGGGMKAFLGSELQQGIEVVLNLVKFSEALENTDLVITGEGKIDSQSLDGKAVIGVSHRAKKKNIPVIAIVGDIGDDILNVYNEGICGIFSINRVAIPYQQSKKRAAEDLVLTVDNLMRLFRRLEL